MAQSNSFSVRRDFRTKACRFRTRHSRMNFVRASGVRLISSMTASVTCRSLSMIMAYTSSILKFLEANIAKLYPGDESWRRRLACPDAGWAGGCARDRDAKKSPADAGATKPQQIVQ